MSSAGVRTTRTLRLPITSDCNLRCSYCFVDKEKGEDLSREDAVSGIDWLFSTPGEVKEIDIYGGEPFLRFEFIREIVRHAASAGGRAGKSASIRIATNGMLVKDSQLAFLERHGVRLHVSVDGAASDHDGSRFHADGSGSWRQTATGIRRVLSRYPEAWVTALMGVAPERAHRCAENFKLLESLGFRQINIEPISGRAWSAEELGHLRRGLTGIWNDARGRMIGDDPVFLASVAKSIRRSRREEGCSLLQQVELFPDGYLYAHSYPLPANAAGKKLRLGTPARLAARYRRCLSESGSNRCGCWREYSTHLPPRGGEEAVRLRDSLASEFSRSLIRQADQDRRFERYLIDALRRSN